MSGLLPISLAVIPTSTGFTIGDSSSPNYISDLFGFLSARLSEFIFLIIKASFKLYSLVHFLPLLLILLESYILATAIIRTSELIRCYLYLEPLGHTENMAPSVAPITTNPFDVDKRLVR